MCTEGRWRSRTFRGFRLSMYLEMKVLLQPPLRPAGHLPLEGGDRPSPRISPIADVAGKAEVLKLPISPLEGEMAGRPEGGVEERHLSAGIMAP